MTTSATMRTRAGVLERRCSRCRFWWPVSQFSPAKGKSAGYHCTCKPCIALYKRESRARLADPARKQDADPFVHSVVDARTAPRLVTRRNNWFPGDAV